MTMGRVGAFAVAILSAVVLSSQTWGAEFYVDSLAGPGGTGSLSAAFRSIQEGLNVLKPGDTLYVRGDTSGSGRIYSETPMFPVSGFNGSPITVRSFPGDKVIVSTTETIILDRDFIVVKGFIFDHQKLESDAIRWSGNNINLSECEVRNGSRDGIDVSAKAKNVTISHCVIHHFVWADPARRDAHCIVANPGVIGVRITGNTIYNCSGDGIHLFANDSTPVSLYVTNAVIENNTIYSTLGANSENGLDLKGGIDIDVKQNDIYGFTQNKAVVVQKGAKNLRLEGNRIHDSARGVEFRWEAARFQHDITVTRNVFFNITGQYALKFDGVVNVEVIHNTFHNNAGNSIRVEHKGIIAGIIKNNLFHLSGSPRISGRLAADYSHNGWFTSSAGALTGSQDTVGVDPLFWDVLANDFRLISTSPAIDRGTPVGIPYRGLAPDLGAFENIKTSTPTSASTRGPFKEQ
jgi:Right handed beta helix region